MSDQKPVVEKVITHRSTEDAISNLSERVFGLEVAMSQLQPYPEIPAISTLEGFAIEPTIRLRINHSHTLKEGWRLSETTVEWSGPGKPDEAAITDALLTANHLGQREAALRNAPAVVEGTVDDDVAV